MKNLLKTLPLLILFIVISSCAKEDEDNFLTLGIGASKSFTVNSAEKWNATNLKVNAGETYSFNSTGTWTDLNILTDADGFTNAMLDPFNDLKRDTSANWFELIASSDTTNLYRIGSTNTITFNESGELQLFANDADDFYFNNSGSITTTVTRE